jgi:hypothetical protein
MLPYTVAGGSNSDTDGAYAVLFAAITVWNSNLYGNLCDNMARVRISLGSATNIRFLKYNTLRNVNLNLRVIF